MSITRSGSEPAGRRRRRWVLYRRGPVEASRVPPEWHAWLHYTTEAPLHEKARRALGEAAPAEPHRHAAELSPGRA